MSVGQSQTRGAKGAHSTCNIAFMTVDFYL